MTSKRYEVRRTLDVRPEDYDKSMGWLYTSSDDLEDAIHRAEGRSALGYRSRVVDTETQTMVWIKA